MKEGATRRSNRLELSREEASLMLKAIKAQRDVTEQCPWPEVAPITKEECLQSLDNVTGKIQGLAHFTTATKKVRAKKAEAVAEQA